MLQLRYTDLLLLYYILRRVIFDILLFPHPGGYRVLELTAGLKVISIACTPDLRDWGTLVGPLGTLMSLCLAG
jgi:hypothetical protein